MEGSYQCYSPRTKENVIVNLHVLVRRKRKESRKYCLQIFGWCFRNYSRKRAPLEYRGVSLRPVIMFTVSKRFGSAACGDPARSHLWFIHRRLITDSYGLGFACGPVRNFRRAFRAVVKLLYRPYTVGYARTNVFGSRTSFVIAYVRSSIRWNICV